MKIKIWICASAKILFGEIIARNSPNSETSSSFKYMFENKKKTRFLSEVNTREISTRNARSRFVFLEGGIKGAKEMTRKGE